MQQAHPLIKATEPSIDLVQLALRNVVWLVIAGVAGLVLGVASYKAMGPSYVANTQILVKLKRPFRCGTKAMGHALASVRPMWKLFAAPG